MRSSRRCSPRRCCATSPSRITAAGAANGRRASTRHSGATRWLPHARAQGKPMQSRRCAGPTRATPMRLRHGCGTGLQRSRSTCLRRFTRGPGWAPPCLPKDDRRRMRDRPGDAGTPPGRPMSSNSNEAPLGIEARLAREARDLAVKRADPSSAYFRGNASVRADRRRFVLQSMAALGGTAAVVRSAFAETGPGATVHDVPADASKTPGYPLADESYGTRSQFETEVRRRFKTPTPLSSWTMTPLEAGCGIITPSGLHFERSHAGTAVIDPSAHSLYVHGMVREPRKYSMK